MRLLAFDPSLSKTGWALLTESGPAINLTEFGDFEPKGSDLADRCNQINRFAARIIDGTKPEAIAVELPRAGFIRGESRSATHLPSYGMAVGVVLAACHDAERETGAKVITVAADVWGRSIPRGGKGEAKEGRIQAVRLMFGRDLMDTFKSAERASAVADAALMGRHAITHWRTGLIGKAG
jgi:Holliday junction resolvasome RuvABC endonuclease subunit